MAFVKGYLLLLYFSPLSQNRTPTVVTSEIVRFSSISPRRLHNWIEIQRCTEYRLNSVNLLFQMERINTQAN